MGHRADRHRPFTPRRLRAQRPAQHRRRRLPVHGWPRRPLPRALRSGCPASGGRRQRHPALDPGGPPQLRAAGGPVRASGRRARGRGGRQPRRPTRALGAPAGHDDRRHQRGRDRCGPVVGRDTRGPVGRHQRARVRVPAELPVGRLRPHLLRLRALAPAVRGPRAGRGRHRLRSVPPRVPLAAQPHRHHHHHDNEHDTTTTGAGVAAGGMGGRGSAGAPHPRGAAPPTPSAGVSASRGERQLGGARRRRATTTRGCRGTRGCGSRCRSSRSTPPGWPRCSRRG